MESSLHFRNSRKHFQRCASFGAVDFDIGEKAIFMRFLRFFVVVTKISVLRQKLPFWDESCRFQDIICRLGDKCRFRDNFFVRAIFGNFSKFLRQFFQILTAKLGCPSHELRLFYLKVRSPLLRQESISMIEENQKCS